MKLDGLRKCAVEATNPAPTRTPYQLAADFNSRTSFPSALPYAQNDLLGTSTKQKAQPFIALEDTTLKNNIRGGAEMSGRSGVDTLLNVGHGLGSVGTTSYDISNRVMHNKYPQTYSYDPDHTLTKSWTRMVDDLSHRYGVRGFKYPNGQTAQEMWQSGHPDGGRVMLETEQLRRFPSNIFLGVAGSAGRRDSNAMPGAAIPAIINSYGDYVNSEDRYKDPPPKFNNTPTNNLPIGR